MTSDSITFRDRYGPWTVVAGGSDGIGEGFARQLAAGGLGVVLLARRQEPLQALAAELQAQGAALRTAAVDLTGTNIVKQLQQVTQGLDIGLLVYNAGADQGPGMFIERSLDQALGLVYLNCRGPVPRVEFVRQLSVRHAEMMDRAPREGR
jgi:short-subunit dehydrogenase